MVALTKDGVTVKGDNVMVTSDGGEVNVKGDEDNIVMTSDADGVTMQCGDFAVKVRGEGTVWKSNKRCAQG